MYLFWNLSFGKHRTGRVTLFFPRILDLLFISAMPHVTSWVGLDQDGRYRRVRVGRPRFVRDSFRYLSNELVMGSIKEAHTSPHFPRRNVKEMIKIKSMPRCMASSSSSSSSGGSAWKPSSLRNRRMMQHCTANILYGLKVHLSLVFHRRPCVRRRPYSFCSSFAISPIKAGLIEANNHPDLKYQSLPPV